MESVKIKIQALRISVGGKEGRKKEDKENGKKEREKDERKGER